MNGQLARSVVELFRPPHRKSTIILLSSSLLVCLWKVFGSRAFYASHLEDRFIVAGDPVATAGWYEIGMCFLLLGVVPMAIVKFVLGERLADYGIRPGNIRMGLVFAVAAAPIIFAISYFSAPDPVFAAEYPLNKHAGTSGQAFAVHAVSLLFFYIGWEFHFRGFLQHGLMPSGLGTAVWTQTLAATLAHLGKPNAELFACIPASMFWGLLALRSQSLWAGLVQHWLLGVTLDYFISFGT